MDKTASEVNDDADPGAAHEIAADKYPDPLTIFDDTPVDFNCPMASLQVSQSALMVHIQIN